MAAVSLLTTRLVVVPIRRIAARMAQIAQGQGDLTATLAAESADEVGDIARAYNAMTASLRETVAATATTAGQVLARLKHWPLQPRRSNARRKHRAKRQRPWRPRWRNSPSASTMPPPPPAIPRTPPAAPCG
ncbi:HAMP domain-containing protein [Pseudothauera lacus]|nr:HAMP domain-containing protein [Pseudothauera lacus]